MGMGSGRGLERGSKPCARDSASYLDYCRIRIKVLLQESVFVNEDEVIT